MACFIRNARTHINPLLLQIIVQPRCFAGILEDVDDIHKRKQLREHGIDGLHVVAGIFSGNSPFLSLSMVLISREIPEAQGETLGNGRKDTKRARARRRKGWTCFLAVRTRYVLGKSVTALRVQTRLSVLSLWFSSGVIEFCVYNTISYQIHYYLIYFTSPLSF